MLAPTTARCCAASSRTATKKAMQAAAAASPSALLRALCEANRAILAQKLGMLDALAAAHGPPGASRIFRAPASAALGGATVGQHYRHSVDHIERAVAAAAKAARLHAATSSDGRPAAAAPDGADLLVVPYDRRERGGPDESDMEAARERIGRILRSVDEILLDADSDGFDRAVAETPVAAVFMLSGDSSEEFRLPSTVARELGFGVHHAIHHLATVRAIVLGERWLGPDQLEPDFGRAPSTVRHDRASPGREEGGEVAQ